MTKMRKVSLALSPEHVDDVDYLAGRLGVSRSAFINSMLGGALPGMRKLFEQIPISPTPTDVVRFRGESAKLVEGRIGQLQGLADDLLSR